MFMVLVCVDGVWKDFMPTDTREHAERVKKFLELGEPADESVRIEERV